MSPTTSDDSLGPVTPLAMPGTLRLRTSTVITVANIPSVRASSLPLPSPGMLDWSKLISATRESCLLLATFKPISSKHRSARGEGELWWAGGDSNSRPCGLERVSACKADVLSGAFPKRAELPAHRERVVECLQVDYDLGRDYPASKYLRDCPFIERIASFHSGHFVWRGRSRLYTSTVNTIPKEAQRSQSTTTDYSTATVSLREYEPTTA